jgi:hypothetical protein
MYLAQENGQAQHSFEDNNHASRPRFESQAVSSVQNTVGRGSELPPTKPLVLTVNADGIPSFLKQLNQWVLFRLTWKSQKEKWDRKHLVGKMQ